LAADVKVTTTQNIVEERDYAYNPIGNLTSFTSNNGTPISYSYPATGNPRPHAATAKGSDSYAYDANGNMISRVENGVAYCQTFDTENHLVTVENLSSGDCSNKTVATTTTYVYDADGNRVKRIVNDGTTTTTTTYVAGMEIEIVSGTETQRTVYYPAGGAFRVIGGANAGLYFRHSDHLGSTSVLSDATGAKVTGSDVVYAPFGAVRSGTESTLTDFGYTGQKHDLSTGGLMYYGARYYLPELGRFISADTIVPSTSNPQALNRYTYVLNSPINMVDPTGHIYTTYCIDSELCGTQSTEEISTPIPTPTFVATSSPTSTFTPSPVVTPSFTPTPPVPTPAPATSTPSPTPGINVSPPAATSTLPAAQIAEPGNSSNGSVPYGNVSGFQGPAVAITTPLGSVSLEFVEFTQGAPTPQELGAGIYLNVEASSPTSPTLENFNIGLFAGFVGGTGTHSTIEGDYHGGAISAGDVFGGTVETIIGQGSTSIFVGAGLDIGVSVATVAGHTYCVASTFGCGN